MKFPGRLSAPACIRRVGVALIVASLLCLAAPVRAEVVLPPILGSNMVLQRDMPLPIWGKAAPGEEVTVTIGKQTEKATAAADGTWSVKLKPLKASDKPLTMTVAGKNKIVLSNILVGEVWECSGQSNMGFPVHASNNGAKEVAEAQYPNIRLYLVPLGEQPTPDDGMTPTSAHLAWLPCSKSSAPPFSAVAYFFGRELHKKLNVPIGLIANPWGGRRIDPFTPPEAIAAVPELKDKKQEKPALIYNKMVRPVVPFGIRGAIWYQGESNHEDGMVYYDRMRALIGGWRKAWGQGDFPFYFVQLAPYDNMYKGDELPNIWEAQTAALKIPNTGMVVTNDVGNVKDIHPRNKQEVGRRLALWALARTYGQKDIVPSGPLFKSAKTEGSRMRVEFAHVGGGLASRDGKPLTNFEIAGADNKFVPAEATIDGGTVLVEAAAVKEPKQVRFAWSRAATPNLMNKDGLPAGTFRSENWQGGTGE